MIGRYLLAGLLVLAGVGLLAAAAGRRPSLHDQLRELDGEPSPDGRRWRVTGFSALVTACLVVLPVYLAAERLWWPLVVAVSALVAGVVAAMAVELRVRLRGRGRVLTVPLTFRFQRRLAARLVAGLTALWPVPPLRPAPVPRPARPTAGATSRSATRLLVVRLPAAEGLRLWDLAEQYLGSRLRYRDLLILNRDRRAPTGEPITEASVVRDGWSLLVPGDARGPGLVPLPPSAPRVQSGERDAPAAASAPAAPTAAPPAAVSAPAAPTVVPPAAPPVAVPAPAALPAAVPAPTVPPTVPPTARPAAPTAPARPVPVPPAGPPAPSGPAGPAPAAAATPPPPERRVAPAGAAAAPRAAGPGGHPAGSGARPPAVVPAGPVPARPRAAAGRAEAAGPPAGSTAAAGPAPGAARGATAPPGTRAAGGTGPSAPPGGPARPVPAAVAAGPAAAGAQPAPGAGSTPRSAALAWDLVHACLLADGLLDTLDGLREQRMFTRPPGAGVPLPDVGAARIEESAHLGGDRDGAAFLELALRAFAAGCGDRDVPRPDLVSAHLGAGRLELRLAGPDRSPPPPFEATRDGSTWVLDRRVSLDDVPDVAPRLPGLVSVGPDASGHRLVNLPVGGIISLTGHPGNCRLVAQALAVELVSKRWSEAPLVTLVGFGTATAGLSPRLRCGDDVAQVLDHPVRGDVVILAEPPTDAELSALRTGAGSDWFGAPVLVVLGERDRARWRFRLEPRGLLACPELDLRVGAQALAPATLAAMTRLVQVERVAALPGVQSSTVHLPRPVDLEIAEVVLHLFGRPRLSRGRTGVAASGRTVEIVAFLALLGSASVHDLIAALWPRGADDATVEAALSTAVAELGVAERGTPLLHLDEVLHLAPEVQLDWHLFVALAAAGDHAPALALLGPTAADDIERGLRHYPWMARVPLVRQLPGYVADVALRLDQQRREPGTGPGRPPGEPGPAAERSVPPPAHRQPVTLP